MKTIMSFARSVSSAVVRGSLLRGSLLRSCWLLALLAALILQGSATTPGPAQAAAPAEPLPAALATRLPCPGIRFGLVTDLDGLPALEQSMGHPARVIKIYQAFWHGAFWTEFARRISNLSALEFVSYDPVIQVNNQEKSLNTCEVLSGDYDQKIKDFAGGIKAWGGPLWISTAGEMNANWELTAWTGDKNFGPNCDKSYAEADDLYKYFGCTAQTPECADGPERYRAMYRHIHDVAGLDPQQVAWVWVVNHASFPSETAEPWNAATNYYPGDGYVDIIAVDGYNWGYTHPSGWQTFDQIFGQRLAQLTAAYPGKRFIIGEFATAEGKTPNEKLDWLRDAYLVQLKYRWRMLEAAIYYNSAVNGDPTFLLTSSEGSIQAIREILADPYFQAPTAPCVFCPVISKGISQ